MTRVLRIRHSALYRGNHRVLEPGEVEIPLGAKAALIGVNGAGKTSLLMTIGGLLRRSACRVETSCGDSPVDKIAYLPQAPVLPRWLTVRQAMLLNGLDPVRAPDVVPHIPLNPLLDAKCDELSAGQRQTVAVALALCQRAPLTLLDEPLSSVDIQQRPRILDALRAMGGPNGQAVTIISSHIAADLSSVCDWIIVIRDGRYVFQASREELLSSQGAQHESQHELAVFERRILELLG